MRVALQCPLTRKRCAVENSIDIRHLPIMVLEAFAIPGSIICEKARSDERWGQSEVIIANGPHDLFLEIKDNGDGFWRGRDLVIFTNQDARDKEEDPIFKIRVSGETFKYLGHQKDKWAYLDHVFWDMRWPGLREMGRHDASDRILEFLCNIQIFIIQSLRSPVFRFEQYTPDRSPNNNPNRVPYNER